MPKDNSTLDATDDTSPLFTMLKPAERIKLQEAYTPERMDEVLMGGFMKFLPVATPLIEGMRDILRYDPDFSKRVIQERITIALLAAGAQTTNLAIHIYIVMADKTLVTQEQFSLSYNPDYQAHNHDETPLSVNDIANVLILTGMYTGIDKLSGGIGVLAATLGLLSSLTKQEGTSLDPGDVVHSIQKLFEPQLHQH